MLNLADLADFNDLLVGSTDNHISAKFASTK